MESYSWKMTFSDFSLSTLCLCSSAPLNLCSSIFYAKQTQFQKTKMNISVYFTKDYEKISNWTFGENKPKQTQLKPKQSQFKPNLPKAENEHK